MAQLHKIELQTQIRSSPSKLFDVYKNKIYLMPKICPNKVEKVDVLEGDGKSLGSVRLWTYVMGVPVIAKDKIVAVDEEKRSITFELIDGEVTKYFNHFKATFVATTAKANMNLVKWILEYEKASEDVPNPSGHLEFLANMVMEIDAYLFKA
ncbi:Polyketide cyclase/dehydrase and lipid transport superfamily protein [Striga hermonthica]|uniref:Polyketide cyclase/dehydrase and lipid transport superfamily protein n=1 Tax=Striga hermonthica TaxID=68872 RepID=A0A9N7R8B0_STRHE|nr:Polyketide cyclase/dehydrase and lipid transport superfamily protein [Striga hermonthica]